MTPVLPNLIVVGAMKCGTTALHRSLGRHPEIGMSGVKELNFFSRDSKWNLGVDWYKRQFDATLPVRGETSPSYTDRGQYPDSAARVAEVIPDARLIYLVRDPVDRILADVHRVSAERETRSWPTFVDSIEGSDYLNRSRYFWELEPYVLRFPRHRILVLGEDRLRDARRETLREVFRFLGVDDTFWSPSFAKPVHETDRRRTRTAAGRALAKIVDPLLGQLPGDLRYRIGHGVYLPVSRRVAKPKVDEAVRHQRRSLLHDDIQQFQRLFESDSHIGRETRAWLGQS